MKVKHRERVFIIKKSMFLCMIIIQKHGNKRENNVRNMVKNNEIEEERKDFVIRCRTYANISTNSCIMI